MTLNWTKNASFSEKVLISIIKSLIEHNITDTDLFLVDRGYDRGPSVVTKPCQQWLIHIYFHATSDFDYRFNPLGLSNF